MPADAKEKEKREQWFAVQGNPLSAKDQGTPTSGECAKG